MTTGYSSLCDAHKQVQRRHGHPEQAGITAQRLEPFRKRVRARRAKNKDNNAWALLEARWGALQANADARLAEWNSGKAMVSVHVNVAAQLKAIAEAAEAREAVEVVLAMFLLRDAEPRRFASDRSFDFQLVRRVRALAPRNAGSYWNAKTQRVTKVYKDLPPRVSEHLGQLLRDTFGLAGLMLADKERAEAMSAEREQRALADALQELA